MGWFKKLRAWELMVTVHVAHIEVKFDLRPFVWYMPFMVYIPKRRMHGRIVEGGTFNIYVMCFRLWTFRTSYFGLGLDFALDRNPYFGRLTPWRGDIVFDMQKKPEPTPKEH